MIITRKIFCLSATMTICFFSLAKAQTKEQIQQRKHDALVQRYKNDIELFNQGKLAYENMPALINLAKLIGDEKASTKVCKVYKEKYLDKLSDQEAFTNEHLKFLAYDGIDLLTTHDRYFRYFLNHPAKDDSIAGDKFHSDLQPVRFRILTKEIIAPKLYDKNGKPILSVTPDFSALETTIRKKYPGMGNEAKEIVLEAEIQYFKLLTNWPAYCKAFIEKAEEFGMSSVIEGQPFSRNIDEYFPNQATASLLLHCDDHQILEKAIRLEDRCMVTMLDRRLKGWARDTSKCLTLFWSNDLGNYAGLLYKAGHKEVAIRWMEYHVRLYEKANIPNSNDKDYYYGSVKALERMKKGEKIDETWEPHWFN